MPSTHGRGKNESGSYSAERDSAFIDLVLRSLCKDREFLQRATALLPADFFEPPTSTEPGEYARWVIADIASEYYSTHRQTVGALITTRVKRFIKRNNVQQLRAAALVDIADRIVRKKPANRDMLLRELAEFTAARAVKSTMHTLNDEYESGSLSLERLREVYSELKLGTVGQTGEIVNYFARDGFKRRSLARRLMPFRGIGTGVFEIDAHMSAIGQGHVCIVMGPPKRGKTMALSHVAVHSVLYSHNAGFVTLEMPKMDFEGRMDTYTTGMTREELEMRPKRGNKRYLSYVDKVSASGGQLFIVDSQEIGGNTIAHIDAFVARCKSEGNSLNSLYIDYDEFLFPNVRVKDNPVERYNLLYLELKRIAEENRLCLWIAAQTQRNTDTQKVLNMGHAAHDMGKIRKADFVLGLGNGADYDERAVYMHIIANRHGAAGYGQYCVTDRSRGMIYDIEETNRILRQNPIEPEVEEE